MGHVSATTPLWGLFVIRTLRLVKPNFLSSPFTAARNWQCKCLKYEKSHMKRLAIGKRSSRIVGMEVVAKRHLHAPLLIRRIAA